MAPLESQLSVIRSKVAAMGLAASEMFDQAVQSLLNSDHNLARGVIERDSEVDGLENEIEGLCLKFLALKAPKAQELRYAVAATRLISDIERIADHAAVLGRESLNRRLWPILSTLPGFSDMGRLAGDMVRKAVDSFLSSDDLSYLEICRQDKKVGERQRELNEALAAKVAKEPEKAPDIVSLVNIVRRMERTADHAKNVAVMVPYITKGLLLRHNPEDGVDADYDD
ncbi:MAG: phosphate signaling complex protein PhoU [Deltaproteobacteria bacterium]|jgi:phosphate transport system protein|nr:phosphate signaling complex protein PhoU [Deltaproteobacteria bacterium]